MRLRLIAIAILGAVVLGGAYFGRDLIENGSGGGWSHEAGDVFLAERSMSATFGQGRPNLTFVVEAREGDVDSRTVATAARDFIDLLESRSSIADVTSYWTLGRPDWLRSEDGTQALIMARIPGASKDIAQRTAGVDNLVRNAGDAISVTVGGEAILQADVQQALGSTTIPLVAAGLLSLLFVFYFLRNPAGTALIGAAAALAVSLSLLGYTGLTQFREVPVLSVMLGVALAWGLATAGGLLIMSRFIAERSARVGRRDAVVATVATAGRTVALASVGAAAAGFALWPLPTALLRSTAYTLGIAGLAAGVSTVVGLGVLLAIVGVRVMRLDNGAAVVEPVKPLGRVASIVRSRPVVAALLLAAVFGPLGVVAAGAGSGEPTPYTVSAEAQSRRVAETVATAFPEDEASAPFVLARSLVEIPGARDLTIAYAASLSEIDGVVRVDSVEGSFVGGAPIDVPQAVSRQFIGEEATWFNVPIEGDATGQMATQITEAMTDAEAPYRVTVAGPAARQAATGSAIEARVPWFVLLLVGAMVLLVAWLLRSVNAAVRVALSIVLMASAAGVVVWLASSTDIFSAFGLSASTRAPMAAVGPPIAWAVSAAIAAAMLLFGWGSIREVFDATQDSRRSPATALAATAQVHGQAAFLLLVPFVPFLFTPWSTARLIGAAALAGGLLAGTVGRSVALPAFSGFAVQRLWPIDLEGRVRRVYATTPALSLAVGAAGERAAALDAERAVLEVGPPVLEAAPVLHAEDEPMSTSAAESADADTVDESATVGTNGPPPDTATEGPTETPAAAPTAQTLSSAPALDAGEHVAEVDDQSRNDEFAGATPVSDDRVEAHDAPASPSVDGPPIAGELTAVAVDEPVSDDLPAPVTTDEPVAVDPEPVPVVEVSDDGVEEVAVASSLFAPDADDTEQPAIVAVATEPSPAGPPVVETPVAVSRQDRDGEDDAPALAAAEVHSDDEAPEPAESGTVDVASLTASVIAALESGVPFTTEIGEAFVANPANNLSRVMEAILRDASTRGGEEVLVYGHASRDRYRWMVVDSGPSSESDPDRARTLAEAQRFIRRVGGVVDCRPQGDFTVFVVEIPMAS